jgi:hypothetical protein
MVAFGLPGIPGLLFGASSTDNLYFRLVPTNAP